MARIRSIHPSTPIDPELASLPVEGRLLFIYSWTAADDAGNLEGNPLGLRMALFPADAWANVARIAELVEMLIAGRFFIPYECDRKQYLHIRNFARYQKLDHPTAPRVPLAPGQEYTFHVRKGNSYIDRTESGPPLVTPERHTNNTLTAHEQHTNNTPSLVCLHRRTGLEGNGLDLERKGQEGRGPGRETESAIPDDGPTKAGAASRDSKSPEAEPANDNGAGKVNPIADTIGSVIASVPDQGGGNGKATIKAAALQDIARQVGAGEIDLDRAGVKLRTFGFTSKEINSPSVVATIKAAIDKGTVQ